MDGRVTEIIGVPGFPTDSNSSYGNDKDKAMDMKLQVLRETKYLPALSLGIMDPQGTRKYPSQYLVASKQLYPFDFTVGFGNGRFGKEPLPSSDNGRSRQRSSPIRTSGCKTRRYSGASSSPHRPSMH